jgi:hypothetical protein
MSLWVQVWVEIEKLPNWLSGSLLYSHGQFNMVGWMSSNPSELERLPAVCPAGTSVDSYNVVFAAG